jgi:hypothetical protein
VLEARSEIGDSASEEGAALALRGRGIAPLESVFPPVNMVFQCFDPVSVDLNVLQNPANWYLTMGDSDVI